MIAGLVAGFVVAVLFGTGSGITAASGYAIGAVAGPFFQSGFPVWARLVSVLLLVAILAFAWWE